MGKPLRKPRPPSRSAFWEHVLTSARRPNNIVSLRPRRTQSRSGLAEDKRFVISRFRAAMTKAHTPKEIPNAHRLEAELAKELKMPDPFMKMLASNEGYIETLGTISNKLRKLVHADNVASFRKNVAEEKRLNEEAKGPHEFDGVWVRYVRLGQLFAKSGVNREAAGEVFRKLFTEHRVEPERIDESVEVALRLMYDS